jgi:hypothetical protein
MSVLLSGRPYHTRKPGALSWLVATSLARVGPYAMMSNTAAATTHGRKRLRRVGPSSGGAMASANAGTAAAGARDTVTVSRRFSR